MKQKQFNQHDVVLKNKPLKRKVGRSKYLTPRDLKILNYLWRWRVASTASVHEMINRPNSEYSTYKILFKLEGSGFITCRFDYSEHFYVWMLTDVGFSIVKSHLPELSSEDYFSQHLNHDRLVQAFHLGEWATLQFPIVQFFTRQEVLNIHPEDFPEWMLKSQEHKPDGVTHISGAKKNWTFAYEVELNTKQPSKYERIVQYYKYAKSYDRVYWLVADEITMQNILKSKKDINDESFNYHVFIMLADFKKNGWDAMIVNQRSENVHTMRENLQEICGDIYSEMIGHCRGNQRSRLI